MGNHIAFLSKQQALMQACTVGNSVVVQELLQLRPELAVAQLRNRGTKNTPLEIAAANGQEATLAIVFEAVVRLKGPALAVESLSYRSLTGYTPVMLACQAGSPDCVKFLLRAGALPWSIDPNTGNTALHHCVLSGSLSCINVLLGQEFSNFPTHTMLNDTWGWAKFSDLRNLNGLAAIHLAAAKGDAGMVRVLLQGGASAELTVEDCYVVVPWCGRGSTALHLAASLGYRSVTQVLLDSAAQTGVDLLRIRNQQGFRAAHCAQLSQQREVAAMLAPEYDYSDNSHRLRRYARLMVQAASVQPWESGVPLRVTLMLQLKTIRQKQLEELAAVNSKEQCIDDSDGTEAASDLSEAPEAHSDEAETSSAAADTTGEASASGTLATTEELDDIAAAQAIVGTGSMSTRESLGLTMDIDSVYQALCVRDSARMPGIMSTWLGGSNIEPSDLPNDWQLQIACIALNCAATLSSGIGVSWFDQDSAARTAEILLQLGAKIMKACLWPPPAATNAPPEESGSTSSCPRDEKRKEALLAELSEGEECPICMGDTVAVDTEIKPCGHRVCMKCAFEIVCSSCSNELLCPFCRTTIKSMKAADSDDGSDEAASHQASEEVEIAKPAAAGGTLEANSSADTAGESSSSSSQAAGEESPSVLWSL